LAKAKSLYDFVIIDTPPLTIVADAFALAEYADHTLFVIRQNYTPISLLRTLQDSYSSGKLRNVSIVLNDIYRSGHGYGYRYGYGYGYGYTSSKKNNGYGYYEE
jgi:Mrp family chromosome partitioning ATPase